MIQGFCDFPETHLAVGFGILGYRNSLHVETASANCRPDFHCTLQRSQPAYRAQERAFRHCRQRISPVRQNYVISNTGSRPVALREWKAISGHGSVVGLPAALAPGESKTFAVELNLPGTLGESLFRYALFTDESDVERYRFTLSGRLLADRAGESVVDFGAKPVLPDTRQELALSAREEHALRLIEVVEAPDWLKVEIDQATLKTRVATQHTLGLKSGVIRIATNLPQQPFVEIKTRALIGGNLESSIYAVGFKPATVGETATAGMDIHYRGKASLEKLQIELPPDWTSTRSRCVDPATDGRACVRVTVRRTIEESGQTTGELRFRMPGEAELVIPYGLIGLGKDQNVRELLINEDAAMAKPDALDISTLLRREEDGAIPLEPQAVADPVPAEKVTRTRGSGPVHLKWTARNDSRLYGYMVYRAADRAGPFRRVNERPIPTVSTKTDEASQYIFTDHAVEPGKTYYYYIDSMGRNGTQERLSPVLSKSVTVDED